MELLAPVGNFEQLEAALQAGADSVFLGIGNFNMRASGAKNFALESLSEVVKRCHERGVFVYVTVNIVLYDEEISQVQEIMNICKQEGVDAVIVSDMAALLYADSIGLSVHISTQLSISNIEAVRFYAQYADTVVLARELTLEQMAKIVEQIKKQDIRGPGGQLVAVEIFGHGALCVAVSGRCHMSLFQSNSSASRGKCGQTCRQSFEVQNRRTGQKMIIDNNYVMSSADLCTIGMLPEIVKAGVSVLKIEGRGRSADYVQRVVRVYRDALESVETGDYTEEKIEQWNKSLGTVFNRGLSDGLYRGLRFAKWAGVKGSRASTRKISVGEVHKYYPRLQVMEFVVQAEVQVESGEELLVVGEKTGVVRGEFVLMQVDGQVVESFGQGQEVTMKIGERVRPGDQVYVVREVVEAPKGKVPR